MHCGSDNSMQGLQKCFLKWLWSLPGVIVFVLHLCLMKSRHIAMLNANCRFTDYKYLKYLHVVQRQAPDAVEKTEQTINYTIPG